MERGDAISIYPGHRLLRAGCRRCPWWRRKNHWLARTGAALHSQFGMEVPGEYLDGLRFRFDGAFAQFVKVGAGEVFPVDCDWSDAELGTIPCAYGTAENMVHRANVSRGEHVLVAGASGGVGSAVVQLAKRRGATVTAIAGKQKLAQVRSIGADRVIARDDDIVACLGENAVDVVVDNVAGPAFSGMLKVLKRGGRYASSGAIGGPLVTLDMRDFYLKDLMDCGGAARVH